ncbi:MAG TPA: hypothetical protein VLA13_00305 [Massilibacterium sp.]|nr:hypothetical protein [Massilibacterium sp.]
MTKEEIQIVIEQLEDLKGILEEAKIKEDLSILDGIERFKEIYELEDIPFELNILSDEIEEFKTTLEETDWEFNGSWYSYNGLSQSDFL